VFATNAAGHGPSAVAPSPSAPTPSILIAVAYHPPYGVSTCVIQEFNLGGLGNCALTGDYQWNAPVSAATADGRSVFVTNYATSVNNVVNCLLVGRTLQSCIVAYDFIANGFGAYHAADTIYIDGNLAYVTMWSTGQVKPQYLVVLVFSISAVHPATVLWRYTLLFVI